MLAQTTGLPSKYNGYEIISIVEGNKALSGLNASTFQGMIDRNELLYQEDNAKYHLGYLGTWGNHTKETFPMISKLLEKGSEILVDGFFGSFTFDKTYYDPKRGMRTVASTVSTVGPFPGIDESTFEIILSQACYPGEIIGTDPYGDEDQLYVVEKSVSTGEGWSTVVKLTNGSASAYYNPSLLEANINYYKINHVGVEYTTNFAGVDVPTGAPSGSFRARFRLGGIRGIEGYVTGFADIQKEGSKFNIPMAKSNESDAAIKQMQREFGVGDKANMVIMGDRNNTQTFRATSIMEYLVEKTLMKRTATSHLWQKPGRIAGENGAVTYLNEGVWHQLRRGKIISIPKYMGITKAHIAEAVDYVYRGTNIPWEERQIIFEVGSLAEENVLRIYQSEFQQQIQVLATSGALATLFGDGGILNDKQKNEFMSGPIDDLKVAKLLKVTFIPLIGIGNVKINVNKSLDYLSGNPTDYRGQFKNGYDWTSHSMIIWDALDPRYSNEKLIQEGKTVMGETKIKDNLYLVRPEEGMTFKGQENGRWDRGKTSNILSSSRSIAQGFWAFNSSAKWVPYPERVVMIELSKGARRSGGSAFSF